jgi:hypothetical protein
LRDAAFAAFGGPRKMKSRWTPPRNDASIVARGAPMTLTFLERGHRDLALGSQA